MRSIFTGIGMKKLTESSFSKAFFLFVSFVVCGCQKGPFYTAELPRDQLFGTWVLSSCPDGVQSPLPIESCTLTLAQNGTFEATNFPLVMDYYPGLKLKHTTEQGTWSLEDKGTKNSRPRWKLALTFNQSGFGLELDIADGASGFELFERSDLDRWIGYAFQRQ